MKSKLTALLLLLFSSFTFADAGCSGKIEDIYKWDTFETFSIRLKLPDGNFSNWLSLPTKSDESMALLAFASNRSIYLYYVGEQITTCYGDGNWSQNARLNGYFLLKAE